jgi:signal transduction histidine kinase
MRSRNETVRALRSHEAALGHALARIEEAATELKAKNHLLETARRNLADADRLASIGMMSAGIAHELNTPLSVLKGIAEQIHHKPAAGVEPARAELMLRVVQRLERLSEGLLDFARVRPPETQSAPLRNLAEEAITLVGLDRGKSAGGAVNLVNRVPEGLSAECDADRIVQVLVNVVRNSVDALTESGRASGEVVVEGEEREREGRRWAVLWIRDNGPGIAPEVMSRLFEPFVSTRLDSQGSGLGLAVAEGIVRQHGGVLLARNISAEGAAASVLGAEFEIVLPVRQPGGTP